MKKGTLLIGLIGLFLLGNSQNMQAQSLKKRSENFKLKRAEKLNLTDKYKIIGTSVGFSNVQDTKMSDMVYSGLGIGTNLNLHRTVRKLTHYTGLNAQYCGLLGPQGIESYINGINLRFNKGVLYQLNSENWKIGGSTNLETHGRIFPKIGNDALNAEILATLNFAGTYSVDFNFLKRQKTLDIRGELPIFSYVARYPQYSVVGMNSMLMPLGEMKAFRTTITLITPLKHSNENRYSVSYEWDLYMFKENDKLHKLVSGTHLFTFSYWLKTV